MLKSAVGPTLAHAHLWRTGALTGELEAEGWGLELNPAYPRHLFSELGMAATFEAVAGGGD